MFSGRTLRYVILRCLLMVPTLLGITLVTFLVMDLAPVDRAQVDMAKLRQDAVFQDTGSRDVALMRLRIRYGLVDPETGEQRSVWERYGRWLESAATFRLAGPDEDQASFRARILDALPVSLLLGFWSVFVAILIGVPLGAWLGLRAGTAADRSASTVLFVLLGLPEFLVATFLLMLFGGILLDWFPTSGLRSDGSQGWSSLRHLLDLGWHLVLPVTALALAPTVLIARFLRESISRAAQQPFAVNLRAWGVDRRVEVRRLLRNALSPLATLLGSLLPRMVAGSVVVETVFSLEGLGRLTFHAVQNQDQAMVMALTLVASLVTLGGLLLSDLAQRAVDPRVRLER